MTTAKISRWISPIRTVLVDVRVMAIVDGWAMVHGLDNPKHPFVVYECDLKDTKDGFSDAMIAAGREG